MAPTLTLSPATGYKKGDQLTLTVVDAPRKSTPAVQPVAAETDNIDITNPDTGQVGHGSVQFPAVAGSPAVPVKPFGLVDSSGRAWTLASDDGTTAVYKGIA